ncbi:transporter substrate-binding domain-containing protein [Paracoccus caeni]|uniref:Transporter substrate-binding domain-containing protein n=1 Tax=Paracoccus caeni TaxID=657651 RepID=A0A934VZ87_9RHOB|nr:transporter substrate-binding domain-containing protein [Paracoccus caeni]MBK4216797.1 transporter substrate-binding domain-containing protein [Paracoccus caeni]
MTGRQSARYAAASAVVLLAISATLEAKVYDLSGVEVAEELAARVPDEIRKRGVLVSGSDNAYAPWEYLGGDDGQTPRGIDIDIGRALARTLDLEFESRTAAFPSILPALGSKYDIGLNAFSITNERMKVVNFVSYTETQSLWVVQAGNPTGFDPADYCGRTVAVMPGTYYETNIMADSEACVASDKPPVQMLPFTAQTEAITRVAAGGADATATGGGTAAYAVLQSEGRLENLFPVGAMAQGGLNGIAVTKSDEELTQLLADALNHLIQSGVYDDIFAFWGVSYFTVSEAVINPETPH